MRFRRDPRERRADHTGGSLRAAQRAAQQTSGRGPKSREITRTRGVSVGRSHGDKPMFMRDNCGGDPTERTGAQGGDAESEVVVAIERSRL
jgi:hypothetical protein